VNLPFIAAGPSGPLHLERTLKRSELELLTADLVARTIDACKRTLADAHLAPKQIGQVILVGGMTRMPAVQAAVHDFFGKEPHKGVNPDEVVAVGAAIQGASMTGKMEEVLLLDVTPLSIGVETGGGVFTKLIPRNTTIPTERSEVFTTSIDNQNFVPIHVLQGEREMSGDNRSLARFELTGIPPARRGVPKIQVTFRIDGNGILSVEAQDLGTGTKQNVSITPTSGLSPEDIERLVAEGDNYRASDAERRQVAELKNVAETLIYTTDQALEGYADLLPPAVVEEVRSKVTALRAALDRGELTAMRDAHQALETAAFKIADSMYGSEPS
jgi:molecular chaperone DnaK